MDNNVTVSSQGRGSGIKDFMNSSSLVARVAFLLLVVLLFVVVLQFSIGLLSWFLSPSRTTYIIDGMVDATQQLVFPQDPTNSDSKPINRSINGPDGIEFTWSIWVFINDIPQNIGSKYQHIFHKGNAEQDATTGLNFPNNAPGLYISPKNNELTVIMNTYDDIKEEVTIPNVPLHKWVNIMIRCRNTNLDIYVNGIVTKSMQLLSVPKQNYGDIYVAMYGGFPGYISNLWYFDYALGTAAIHNLVKAGPNTKMSAVNAMSMKNPDYLSLRWFFYGSGDQFNPAKD